MRPVFLVLVFVAGVVSLYPNSASAISAEELYRQGRIVEARSAFQKRLADARVGAKPGKIWWGLMGLAWFEDEIGEHKAAIEHSNEALGVASQLNSQFKIGRSLCWLGWAYSSLGMYDLAIEFYRSALDIGAPNGKIKIVPVWGLAKQELGAILFKMGDVAGAKKHLDETYTFAKDRGILIGVAEGGAHLAEMALHQGALEDATRIAGKAIDAAEKCGCSPYNIARAKVVYAKALLKDAEFDKKKFKKATEAIDDALETAERTHNTRWIAEANLLKSKTIPAHDFQGRYDLVVKAYELLEASENERRGSAQAELGRVFLEDSKLELAEFYLKQGLKINQELFRRVDNSFIRGKLAELHALKGESVKYLEELIKTENVAVQTGNYPKALETQERLAEEFATLGYESVAMEWLERALETVTKQMGLAGTDEKMSQLKARKLEIHEQLLELALTVSQDETDSFAN